MDPELFIQLPSAKDELEEIVDEIEHTDQAYVILSRGKSAAVLVGYGHYQELISCTQ